MALTGRRSVAEIDKSVLWGAQCLPRVREWTHVGGKWAPAVASVTRFARQLCTPGAS